MGKILTVVALPTLMVSDQLSVVTPAHQEGLVDVRVDCAGAEDTLVGAYTYYLESEGDDPPMIDSVNPSRVYTTGGETVTISGAGFQTGATVYVDGLVSSTLVDSNTITFVTPAQDEGLVSVTVMNPDGMSDERAGALLYVIPPDGEVDTAEPEEELDTGEELDKESGNVSCSAAPSLPLALMLLFAWRRKQQ